MKRSLLRFLLAGTLCWTGISGPAVAQPNVLANTGALPWFTVQNSSLVVRTGASSKPLGKNVDLPNGVRLDYRTRVVQLANGTKIQLQEGDMVTLNGEVVQAAANKPAPKPVPAPMVVVAPAAPAPAPALAAPAAFAYEAPAPVNGTLKGVVELGASGFNSFVVRVDGQRNWKLEKVEFGNSLVMENMATDDDVRQGLKAYIGKMLDFGVGGRDIHFVVSSGAAMADVTKRIVKSLESLGYVVNAVTPEREGALGLRAVLPPAYAGKAFVVDIGSGNTKISWLENGQPKSVSSFGAKYYEQNVDPAAVAADVKTKAGQVPAGLRQTCFIIGGIPFELAKAARQGKERYTTLRPADGYAQLDGAKQKAGLSIYQAVAKATGCEQFVFDWDANFTVGYLLSLP